MKLVALGANLPSRFGTPAQTLYAALKAMAEKSVWPVQISRVWKTAPVPFDPAQPWYYNAVAAVQTEMPPRQLLRTLLDIEEEFGRVRTVLNAPRLLDLDLIAYDREIIADGPDIVVPHPRLQTRSFVLLPLQDISEDWVHPQTGQGLSEIIAALPAGQQAEPVDGGWDE